MKHPFRQTLTIALLLSFLFTACEKKEQPIVLPPVDTAATQGRINMGEDYATQVFYDFETNAVVKTSECASWDLSFETNKAGYHLWMNGGEGTLIANTHLTDIRSFTSIPANITKSSFLFDDPSGNPDSTAAGDWRTKNEVYIAKLNDTLLYKFRMLSVNDTAYTMEWCNLKSSDPKTIILNKDPAYNFVFLSFKDGLVAPEPPSALWDVVFTRYRYIYRDLNNFPYYVNGVLLNPGHTMAAADSLVTYASITPAKAAAETCSTNRDVIGFDWKKYNFTTARYEVNPNKCYVLRTRNGQLLKLHFLDFYSASGVKGSPSFESQRMQ